MNPILVWMSRMAELGYTAAIKRTQALSELGHVWNMKSSALFKNGSENEFAQEILTTVNIEPTHHEESLGSWITPGLGTIAPDHWEGL